MATTSSRQSEASTGLVGAATPGRWVDLLPPPGQRPRALSWLNPRVLWRSRNEVVACLYDPVPALRRRWMSQVTGDPAIALPLREFSFALLGDTGEGDHSQYALLPTLKRVCKDTAFTFICSDLIYPAADVNDYRWKFYWPYRTLQQPVYAIPGNHDWYDSLDGFMEHLCDARPLPPAVVDGVIATGRIRWAVDLLRRRLASVLWRHPPIRDESAIAAMKLDRADAEQQQPETQPGPYFVLDTTYLRLVGIDPGIRGTLDHDQAEWLIRVSGETRLPKVLLTGKPLIVDGGTDPCRFLGVDGEFTSVLDVVRHEPFGYVAVIGGDIHNYQRYPTALGDRTLHHVVSGGGGAFMHATHAIPVIDPDQVGGVTEQQFRCYPLRRDSLAVYSRVVHNRLAKSRLGGLLNWLGADTDLNVTPDEAGVYLRDRYGVCSLGNRAISPITVDQLRRRARVICWLLMRMGGGKVFHRVFSPFLDWDDPPFSKNFLRLDVSKTGLRIRCFSVTGTLEQEDDTMIEDDFTVLWPDTASTAAPVAGDVRATGAPSADSARADDHVG